MKDEASTPKLPTLDAAPVEVSIPVVLPGLAAARQFGPGQTAVVEIGVLAAVG